MTQAEDEYARASDYARPSPGYPLPKFGDRIDIYIERSTGLTYQIYIERSTGLTYQKSQYYWRREQTRGAGDWTPWELLGDFQS